MKYSERIRKTVELMEPADCLADIGCDHGYMSILAMQSNLYRKIYAADVNEGPLCKAKENICSFHLEDRIIPVLSDGLKSVPEDINAVVICGMGGLLIRRILCDCSERIGNLTQMILGPHSEIEELRAYLITETDFDIARETALLDAGKHYVLMDLRKKETAGKSVYYRNPYDFRYGTPENQTDLNSYLAYLEYLFHRIDTALIMCKDSPNPRTKARVSELNEEMLVLKDRIKMIKETC